jgi:hypothetical protein
MRHHAVEFAAGGGFGGAAGGAVAMNVEKSALRRHSRLLHVYVVDPNLGQS